MWRASLLPIALLLSMTAAKPPSEIYSPFYEPLLEASFAPDNTTLPQLELLKRQNGNCPSGYGNCAYAGNAGLCCKTNALCAIDNHGSVACCPQGAVCTGTIGGTLGGAATPTTSLSFVSATGITTTASNTVLVGTAGSTTTGFVFTTGQTSGASSRSYVSNPYYPFAYIATTYSNAGACSSAYTSCQTESASCSAYLGGVAGHGVTVSAPNGGVTVEGPTATYPSGVASSVCSSLSMAACSGLVVEACANFGTGMSSGVAARCTGAMKYGAGLGIAMGLAGQVMGYR